MNIRGLSMAAVALAGVCTSAGSASAQCGYGINGYGFGGYWDIGRLYSVLADNVPYYAAFPPVYYSYPVARTYGYSPFAYPPGVMTPEVEAAQPLAIENPYFKGSSATVDAAEAAPAKVDQTTSVSQPAGPLWVINPYVKSAGQPAAVVAVHSSR
jgi:hypothetical protein